MTQNLHLAPEYWVNTIFEFTNMCINQNVIEHFNRGQESTSYMEIFAPNLFLPLSPHSQQANLRRQIPMS